MRKTKPRFKVDSHITRLSDGASGYVKELIESDYGGERFYEWRYLVAINRYLWSIPERRLSSFKSKSAEHARNNANAPGSIKD